MDNEIKRSCIDCTIGSCNLKDSPFPGFCTTTNMDEEVIDKITVFADEFTVEFKSGSTIEIEA